MSILGETDASEVEGAMKKKEKIRTAKQQDQDEEGESPQDTSKEEEKDPEGAKPTPPPAKSGWGTEGGKSANAQDIVKSDIEYNFDEPEEETSRQPDEDTEISTQVAAPPKALVNKVQTIRELHSAQKFSLPSSKDSGVDVSLLTKALSSQEEVMEPDEQWEFNTLFVKVTSELQIELEQEEEMKKKEEEEEEEEAAPASKSKVQAK